MDAKHSERRYGKMAETDLISRQAAIDVVKGIDSYFVKYIEELPSAQPDLDEWCDTCKEYDQERHCCPRFNRVIKKALEDAQPERKRGKWILQNDPNSKLYDWYVCSNCGAFIGTPTNYCSECGSYNGG